MANGFNKKLSSVAFSLQKTYEKILTAKPSLLVVGILAVSISFFLMAGGIYDIMIQPIVAFVGQAGNIISFYPYGITDQLLLESVIIMIFYAMGFAGFLVAYRSTKYAYNPRQAYRFLLVGCGLVIISYVLIELNLLANFS
ncbi:hypothetical protein KJN74_00025 [Candidatus Bathyarchaeota archaeon]|nr:hypothetical protein [Candidatus Bathyarchaeota archaeon]